MPWDGSGNFSPTNAGYTGANIWDRARLAGEKVRADRFDSFTADLGSGLENCLTRTGETAPTADQPMGGNRHTGVGDGVARDDYASVGQLSDAAIIFVGASEVGGTANVITLAPTAAITAYAINQSFRHVVKADNTDSVTVAVSGLAGQTVQKMTPTGLENLERGDLRDGACSTSGTTGRCSSPSTV